MRDFLQESGRPSEEGNVRPDKKWRRFKQSRIAKHHQIKYCIICPMHFWFCNTCVHLLIFPVWNAFLTCFCIRLDSKKKQLDYKSLHRLTVNRLAYQLNENQHKLILFEKKTLTVNALKLLSFIRDIQMLLTSQHTSQQTYVIPSTNGKLKNTEIHLLFV